MLGLGLTLNTAAQTLQNSQTSLQVSSNNISNASNTWYAEEVPVQTETPDIETTAGWLGTGASIGQITQMRNQFLEGQLMGANSEYSQYSALASQLQTIQSEDSDNGTTGISQALGSFFNSWDTLSQDPTNSSTQATVEQSAQNLATTIQTTYNSLNQISTTGLPNQIQDTVNQANTLISQIAQINANIVQAQADSQESPANGLIDQQYKALDNLSNLIPVSYTQNANGSFTVTTNETSGPVTVVSGSVGTDITTTSAVTGGQLGGLLQAQTNLTGYMNQLNTFTSELISQVNNLNGAGGGSAVFTGANASSIGASTTFLSGQTTAGLNSVATSIGNLQGAQLNFSDGTTNTLPGYLSGIQQQIGTDLQTANNNSSYNQSLQTQLQSQQQSFSGVSIDQEMINIINNQQVYEAASKVVETVSTLLSTAIGMVQAH
jgi:flagellar hook-associated protein 1 FlgK